MPVFLLLTACGNSDINKLKEMACAKPDMSSPESMSVMMKNQQLAMEIMAKHANDPDFAVAASKIMLEGCK
jgi:hypothetical protein